MYKPKNKVTCKYCGDTIYSLTSGRFTKCTCKNAFIDETEFYTRIGGDDVIVECLTEEDFRDFIWTTAKGEKIKIRDLSDSHIKNIIKDYEEINRINHYYYELMKKELEIREKETN
jgi:hypothetical protein